MKLTKEDKKAFWEWVKKGADEADCWIWIGPIYSKGYGRFKPINERRHKGAHRVSFFITNGYLPPKGLVLDHLCEVRLCVNPSHLNVTTIYLNASRGWREGRIPPPYKTAAPKSKGGAYQYGNLWRAGRYEFGKLKWIGSARTKEGALLCLQMSPEQLLANKKKGGRLKKKVLQ